MSLRSKVKNKSMKLGLKVAEKVMKTPNGVENIAKAADKMYQFRQQVDYHAEKALHLGGVPSKEDINSLNRQAGRLKRQCRKIDSLLNELEDLLSS